MGYRIRKQTHKPGIQTEPARKSLRTPFVTDSIQTSTHSGCLFPPPVVICGSLVLSFFLLLYLPQFPLLQRSRSCLCLERKVMATARRPGCVQRSKPKERKASLFDQQSFLFSSFSWLLVANNKPRPPREFVSHQPAIWTSVASAAAELRRHLSAVGRPMHRPCRSNSGEVL